jgi:hypothetical protein
VPERKLARCQVVVERPGSEWIRLSRSSRAAFEIVTDDGPHGVEIAA